MRSDPTPRRGDLIALPGNVRQLESVRSRCRAMVTKRALASAAAVVVPFPGADIAADVALLTQLIPAINREFGLTPEQIERLSPGRKALVYRAIVAFGGMMVGRAVSRELVIKALAKVGMRVSAKSAARFVPFAGQALSAGISFGAMKLVGHSHIEDCEQVAIALMEESERPVRGVRASAAQRLRSVAATASARLRRKPPA